MNGHMSHIVSNETAFIKISEAQYKSMSDFEMVSMLQKTFPSLDIKNEEKVIKSAAEFINLYTLQYEAARSRILSEIKLELYYKKKAMNYECQNCSSKFISLKSIKEHIERIHLHERIEKDTKNDVVLTAFKNSTSSIAYISKTEDNVPLSLFVALKERIHQLEDKFEEKCEAMSTEHKKLVQEFEQLKETKFKKFPRSDNWEGVKISTLEEISENSNISDTCRENVPRESNPRTDKIVAGSEALDASFRENVKEGIERQKDDKTGKEEDKNRDGGKLVKDCKKPKDASFSDNSEKSNDEDLSKRTRKGDEGVQRSKDDRAESDTVEGGDTVERGDATDNATESNEEDGVTIVKDSKTPEDASFSENSEKSNDEDLPRRTRKRDEGVQRSKEDRAESDDIKAGDTVEGGDTVEEGDATDNATESNEEDGVTIVKGSKTPEDASFSENAKNSNNEHLSKDDDTAESNAVQGGDDVEGDEVLKPEIKKHEHDQTKEASVVQSNYSKISSESILCKRCSKNFSKMTAFEAHNFSKHNVCNCGKELLERKKDNAKAIHDCSFCNDPLEKKIYTGDGALIGHLVSKHNKCYCDSYYFIQNKMFSKEE